MSRGRDGGFPGMMARSRAQPIAGAIGKPGAKASAPEDPVPKGLREMRRLRRRAPWFVARATTGVARLAAIRISRKRAPRDTGSEVPFVIRVILAGCQTLASAAPRSTRSLSATFIATYTSLALPRNIGQTIGTSNPLKISPWRKRSLAVPMRSITK